MWKYIFSALILYNIYWLSSDIHSFHNLYRLNTESKTLTSPEYISWKEDFKFFAQLNQFSPQSVDKIKYIFVEASDSLIRTGYIRKSQNFGTCYFTPSPVVVMVKESLSKLEKPIYKAIFLHELAHCAYGFEHVSDKDKIMHVESLVPLVNGEQINEMFKGKRGLFFAKYEFYLRIVFFALKFIFLFILIKYRHELGFYLADIFKDLKKRYLLQ